MEQPNEEVSEPSRSSGPQKDDDAIQSEESSSEKKDGDEQQYEGGTGQMQTVITLADKLNALTLEYILQEAAESTEYDSFIESQTVANDGTAGATIAAAEAFK